MTYKTLTISIPAAYPFRLDLTVWALRRRKTNIVDQWVDNQYSRIFVLNNNPVKVTVMQAGTSTEPIISATLKSKRYITDQIQKDVKTLLQKMLGATIDLQPFYLLTDKNDILKSLIRQFLGVKPPRFPSIFEGLINSISCQEVSLDLGILLQNRLSENYGIRFIEDNTILYAFPGPEDLMEISEEDIRKLGNSYKKARAIKELATDVYYKKIGLTNLDNMKNNEAITYLSAIRGIGRWSAEYVLLRGLGRLDIFPGDDIGAQNNLQGLFCLDKKPNYEEIKKLTSCWHPYEGMIYFHLLLNKLHLRGII
jgi:DNA-3-methyladenine glycosylase II